MELFEKGADMFNESRVSIDQQDNNESFENEISNYSDGYKWSSQNYDYANDFNSAANSSQNPLHLDSDKSSFDGFSSDNYNSYSFEFSENANYSTSKIQRSRVSNSQETVKTNYLSSDSEQSIGSMNSISRQNGLSSNAMSLEKNQVFERSYLLTKSASYNESESIFNETNPGIMIDPIMYEAGSFDIVLLIDVREIKNSSERDYMLNEFVKKGISAETIALPVGDYAWVARPKPKPDSQGTSRNLNARSNSLNSCDFETNSGKSAQGGRLSRTNSATMGLGRTLLNEDVIINMIIERKIMSDLCSSIKDGRINEQKVYCDPVIKKKN
ncbi:Crossover junction endonuclease mus81 [Smittium culicis]|uniref:Crossover junction endonuclease MUS81 n=1 Tax=Smittium culicis TaxID=133412 RepID=A0A1R1XVW9_9FUNG|nr:Crossover junction endonuclease mus81 [Smittium culicis]